MQKIDVATVIVTYRSAGLTIAGLRSIQAERLTSELRLRVIVVDNASGDLTSIGQAVEANGWSSWVTLIQTPKNGGFGYGNNVGIERAQADGLPNYVYLLNPDARVRPGAIDALVRFLEAHPTVGIAGSSFENEDGSDWPIAFRFPGLMSEINEGLQIGIVTRLLRRWVVPRRMTTTPQSVDWISGASMMIRPAVFAEIGGFDENYFLYFEETDLCRRAQQAGYSTWYVPESRVMHIAGQSTKVTDQKAQPERLPAYWFESRRRYFGITFGIGYAVAIDIGALLARSVGWLKQTTLGRSRALVPHFVRDLARHSVIWPHNRNLPEVRCLLRRSGARGA